MRACVSVRVDRVLDVEVIEKSDGTFGADVVADSLVVRVLPADLALLPHLSHPGGEREREREGGGG